MSFLDKVYIWIWQLISLATTLEIEYTCNICGREIDVHDIKKHVEGCIASRG